MQVEYFISPYTSTFIRLFHLYQKFIFHCKWWTDGIGGRWSIYIRLWVLCYSFFVFCMCFCLLISHVLFPLFEGDYSMIAVVRFIAFPLFSFSLVPLSRSYWGKTISKFIIWPLFWISLEKGECFTLNYTLGIVPYSIHHY